MTATTRRSLSRFQPPPAADISHPDIRDAVERVTSLRAEEAASAKHLRDLRAGVRQAETDDIAVRSTWIADGRNGVEPKPTREKAIKALEDAERDFRALSAAHDEAIRRTQAALTEHAGAWAATIEQERTRACLVATQLLEDLDVLYRELRHIQGLARWARQWDASGNFYSGQQKSGAVRSFTDGEVLVEINHGATRGVEIPIDVVLGSLRAGVSVPDPEPEPAPDPEPEPAPVPTNPKLRLDPSQIVNR